MRETTTHAQNLIYPDAPVHILDAINRYVQHRLRPGSFVKAVLSNSLVEALNQADPQSLRGLRDIVGYCYWEIPSPCWGSRAKVEAWINDSKPQQNHTEEKSDD